MAEQLGYKPNIAARSLKLNRKMRIAAVLPREIASFFDPLRAGIRAAAEEALGLQVTLDFYEHPRLGTGDLELLERSGTTSMKACSSLPGALASWLRRSAPWRKRASLCSVLRATRRTANGSHP
jgi:LacI family transcriptional regulator